VDTLPPTAFDHESIVLRARDRLRSKLSYTNLGFALAPPVFTISELREIYSAALGYRVSATNLQRVLSRRGQLEPTGVTAASGPSGGRPAARFRFAAHGMQITDPFAVLRPPQDRSV
jgi:8-oxo-dGTP diphosphatase